MDQDSHPENSEEAKSQIAEAERKAWLEKTGGPYHPSSVFGFTTSDGITMLDFFAAQVLRDIVSAEESIWDLNGDACAQARIAELSYELASAMIAARKAVARG